MRRVTHPLERGQRGPAVDALQAALGVLLERGLVWADDRGMRAEMAGVLGREAGRFGDATARIVARLQEEAGRDPTGAVDRATAEAVNALLDGLGLLDPAAGHAVTGQVTARRRAGVAGLTVALVDKGVGGDAPLAETRTDGRGRFAFTVSADAVAGRGKDRLDLQAQLRLGEERLAVSTVRYDAGPEERLDIPLSDAAAGRLASEHEALLGRIGEIYAGPLSELEETDERQDITYLANKSGWDARAVALAALAERHGQAAGIEPAFVYALFRAGVPASEAGLFRTAPESATAIWKSALESGTIPPALEARLDETRARFERRAAAALVGTPAPGTAGEIAAVLRLTLEDEEEIAGIAALRSRFDADTGGFWRAVEERHGPATAARLRLDGQLAFLTLNNAPLVRRLREAAADDPDRGLAALVPAGLHRSEAWRDLVDPDAVPEAIPGADRATRRANYADYMAAQIRLAYPTAVLAERVQAAETPLAAPESRDGVAAFLRTHAGAFEIGQEPLRRFLARTGTAAEPAVVAEIARLERVWQITPDDRAMDGLLAAGIDSALAVARHDEDAFARAFGAAAGGERQARAIHLKARQVHDTVLNVAVAYMAARQTPAIGQTVGGFGQAPVEPPDGGGAAADVLATATLETLFGEMDYCACAHCRSVLSPAAYLVDLLTFLDRPAGEIPEGFANPLDVLLERRPDIQHLPLTCENTLTPVPYIDIVNEVLEHFVVNGLSLAGYQGHSTDDGAMAEDLLASPQFVSDAAYAALADAAFPPPLPFHQPLEALREICRRFDAPLPRLMEALRADDALAAGAGPYGWRDIRLETLGLSPPLARLLTESAPQGGPPDPEATAKRLFGFPPGLSEADFRARVGTVRGFCRRAGITPAELVEILRCRWINPGAALLPRLRHLGLSFAEAKAFGEGAMTAAELRDRLAPGVDPARFGGDIEGWLADAATQDGLMSLLTLSNPGDPDDHCDLTSLELRYADPDMAANRPRFLDFVRINRFIRLWKALGLSIEETDAALAALYPAAEAPDGPDDAENLARLDRGIDAALLQLGVLRRAMEALSLDHAKAFRALLALVGPIGTHGADALYRRMFLSPAIDDPAFAEDALGEVLTDPAVRLLDHGATLRAAFSLTGPEFDRIVAALGFDGATPLGLGTISAVFRRGWLARAMGLSVTAFEALLEATGLDPFGPQDPAGADLLALADLVATLRAAGLTPEEALRLVWRALPAAGEDEDGPVTALARDLRRALDGIEGDFARVDDPDGRIARGLMARVYGEAATERFFGFAEATVAASVRYDHDAAALAPAIQAVAPGRIDYDDFRKTLSFGGVMTPATRDALKAVAGVPAGFPAAVDALFAASEALAAPFFARYPELRPLHDAYRASAAPPAERRTALLEAVLPDLKRRRKRQQARQTAATAMEIEPPMAERLFGRPDVLHAAGDPARPALDDLAAVETGGLTREVSFGPAPAAQPDLVAGAAGAVDHAPGATALPRDPNAPGAAVSVVWRGWLEAPESGAFNFLIDADPGAAATLSIGGRAVPLADGNGRWSNAAPVTLRAGALTEIRLTLAGVADRAALSWSSPGRGVEIVPARHLYGARPVAALRGAVLRARRLSALAEATSLAPEEVAHLAGRADLRHQGAGWANALPVTAAPGPAASAALLSALRAWVRFAGLKARIAPDDARLLRIVEDPAAATARADAPLFVLTRWDRGSVEALLQRFGRAPGDLGDLALLDRVDRAMGRARALGLPAGALIAATTNAPTGESVRTFRAALRARHDRDGWLEILRPINDRLRARQRDALVAHVLHGLGEAPATAHVDTPEKLFEFFLMDVQMEPCMLTSRIRHALSSVQIFVERCLMNLEPRVSPGSLHARQWEWMKRYRVWEANRKIFLFPENWLEPELRDDQSPFFREAMSGLLQGDITEARAGAALAGYLRNLEEVAKLEICGVHYLDGDPGRADDVLHVIGRTAGAKRKYYHRMRAYGAWTPWEPIDLDIEDNPVLPVVWNDRLFLFWLKIMPENEETGAPDPGEGRLAEIEARKLFGDATPKVDVKVMLSWSERYEGAWQPTRTSDPDEPLLLKENVGAREMRTFRKHVRMASVPWKRGLRIAIGYKSWAGVSFFLHNSFSLPEPRAPKKAPHFMPKRALSTAGDRLTVDYPQEGNTDEVLTNPIGDRAVGPQHPHGAEPWEAPFFYEDARHAFHVTTERRRFTVATWDDIGLIDTARPGLATPDLRIRPPEIPPEVLEPVPDIPGFGVIDPAPIEAFVTEDARLDTGIGTGGTVRYGDAAIGPTGSVLRTRRPTGARG